MYLQLPLKEVGYCLLRKLVVGVSDFDLNFQVMCNFGSIPKYNNWTEVKTKMYTIAKIVMRVRLAH